MYLIKKLSYNELRLLHLINASVNLNLNSSKELSELAERFKLEYMQLYIIYKGLVNTKLITDFEVTGSSIVTKEGYTYMQNRDKVSYKEIILELLDFMKESRIYHLDAYFASTGIANDTLLEYVAELMLEKKLIKQANGKFSFMPTHIGQSLTSEGHDKLFAEPVKETVVVQHIKAETYFQGDNINSGSQNLGSGTFNVHPPKEEKEKSFGVKVWNLFTENKLMSFLIGSAILAAVTYYFKK